MPGTRSERSKRGFTPAFLYATLIRWAFTRFYREFAWTYSAVAWLVSRGMWRQWMLIALPYLRGRTLEIGCGTGYVQEALASQSPGTVLGVDASPQMLAITRRRLRRSGLPLRLARGIAQALPVANSSVDTVLATFPAEYILEPATAHEIRRALASGGRLVIVDGAQFTRPGWYERLVDLAYRLALLAPTKAMTEYDFRLPALEEVGFAMTQTWETVGVSRVMVITGTLSDNQPATPPEA